MKKLIYSFFILSMAMLTFSSCEDVPDPFGIPTESNDNKEPVETVDPAGSGTAADPYNVSAALELISTLGADVNSSDIYVKGIVSSISEIDTGQYGNATYFISDTGKEANQLEVYRGYGLNGDKFTKSDDIKVGDEVVVFGKVVSFRGNTPEFTQGSKIVSINGSGGGGGTPSAGTPSGSGTQADPWNAVAANNYINGLAADKNTDKEFYIKGKIAKVANNGEFSSQYGNASFYISDDGKDENTFYVFRTLYLGNKKWTDGDTQIKAGDEVIICGKLVNYKGNTPETVQNESYIYSLNGKTAGGETPPPSGGEAKGSGTEADPWNAVAANNFVSGLTADTNTDKDYYIKGKIAKIGNNGLFGSQYGNASFYISDDGKDENTFYVFRTLYLGNRKWVDGDTQIKVGDEVLICGKLVNYKGNTPETVQNESYIVSLNSGSGGGTTPSDVGTYDKPFSVAEAIANNSGTGVYVKAYIVGWVEGSVYDSGARFDGNSTSATNIIIADSPDETDASKCMPVQLPGGPVRSGVNLKDNPGNYKKQVLLLGNLEKYMGQPGLKSVTYAEIGGSSFGTK